MLDDGSSFGSCNRKKMTSRSAHGAKSMVKIVRSGWPKMPSSKHPHVAIAGRAGEWGPACLAIDCTEMTIYQPNQQFHAQTSHSPRFHPPSDMASDRQLAGPCSEPLRPSSSLPRQGDTDNQRVQNQLIPSSPQQTSKNVCTWRASGVRASKRSVNKGGILPTPRGHFNHRQFQEAAPATFCNCRLLVWKALPRFPCDPAGDPSKSQYAEP